MAKWAARHHTTLTWSRLLSLDTALDARCRVVPARWAWSGWCARADPSLKFGDGGRGRGGEAERRWQEEASEGRRPSDGGDDGERHRKTVSTGWHRRGESAAAARMATGAGPRASTAVETARCVEATAAAMVGRDVNCTDISRPYSNSIRSGRVFIRPYPIPSIQYP